MQRSVKNFKSYLNEYWISVSPGSVVVPGNWYKDSVNSKNYKPVNTNMPEVVDPMFEESDEIEDILSIMKDDQDLATKIKNATEPMEVIDLIREYIRSKRKN